MLRTADQVGPDDRRVMVEPETPVRCDARGHRRALRLALIDRGQPAREQDLAADLQLLGRLVTGIRSEEHTSELTSLMRISYAVFCFKTQNNKVSTSNTR